MENIDEQSLSPLHSGFSEVMLRDICSGLGEFLQEDRRLPEETYCYRHPDYPEKLDIKYPQIFEEFQKPENSSVLTDKAIDTILALPREETVADLSRIVMYKIGRELKAMEKRGENWIWDYTIIHCLAFLTQLADSAGFEAVMEVARQNGDFIWYIDYHMGDTFKMILPHALYATGNGRPEIMEEFLMHPGYEGEHKGYMTQALAFIALEMPDRRDEVLGILRRYLTFMSKNIPAAHGCSGFVAGLVIKSLMDIKAVELLPEIKKLFACGFVNRNQCGDYRKVENELTSPDAPKGKYDFTDIKDFYARVKQTLPRSGNVS